MTRSINLTAAVFLSAVLGACASTQPGGDAGKPAAGAASGAEARAADSASPQGGAQSSAQSQGQSGSLARAGSQSGGAVAGMPSQRSIYYDFDNYSVKGEYSSIVQANAAYLKDHSGAKVRIEGNCDERGSRSYNLALGQRRADAVKKAIELLGVSDKRIESVSYGEEKPKARGADETAWAQNRRSDLVYSGN
jgi:peptidoglycan-associated lipoprotein